MKLLETDMAKTLDELHKRCSVKISKADLTTTRRHVAFTNRVYRILKKVCPDSSGPLLGRLAVDLADIRQVADKHRAMLRQIQSLQSPRDKDKLQKLLAQVEVNLLWHNQYHLSSLKRCIPRLVNDLERKQSAHHRSERRHRTLRKRK